MTLPRSADLIRSLMSDLCPFCGGHKKPRNSTCNPCYRLLPKAQQRAMCNRIGEGYEEAMTAAMATHGVNQFILPGAKR